MPNSVFPQQKPSMSLEHAIQQTIAHCRADQWQQAEDLYRSIKQSQSSPLQGQYWLSYIDALIQAGKPRPAPGTSAAAAPAPAVTPAVTPASTPEAQAIPAGIRLARQPNPSYTARQPRWPWKMALGCGHVPGRRQTCLLLAHFQAARYAQAETLARSLTHAFPLHDLGWKVLVAALRMQDRTDDAQQAQQQRRLSHAGRRKNRRPAPQGISNLLYK